MFAAQAFHWFANDEAVAEFARVLRPGGVFALVWNEGDDARTDPRPEAYRAYLEELHAPSLAAVREGPPFKDLIMRGPFGAVAEEAIPHDHVLDRSGMLDNVRSMSWGASKPVAEQERRRYAARETRPGGDVRDSQCRQRHVGGTAVTHEVKLSSADRVLFPDDGITKGDLFDVLRRRRRRDRAAPAATARSR